MAFELPALPNFSAAVPQAQSPIDRYGRVLQLKALLGQQQLLPLQVEEAQQQVQGKQLQNQQMQLELQSQQAMQKAWSDPDFAKGFTNTDQASATGLGFDPDAMTRALIQKGVLPKDALAMSGQFIERSKNIAEIYKTQQQAGEAQANQREKGYKVLADQIGGILDAPAGKAADMLTQLKQDLVRNQQKYSGVPKEDLQHVLMADLEHLPAISTLVGLDAKIADFHKSKAEAAKAQQGVIPEGGGLSPESQQAVQKDVAVATNPQVQQGKIAVATAEGAARAAIELAAARGSNAALAKVPKELIAPATAAVEKAGNEYVQAQSVTDRLKAMMDAARKGNVVSYQVLPEEGTLQITTSQGVHRINKTEIDQYAGGGSLWQRLEGHVGKQLTGQSIPKSVLDDMAEIQDIQAKGAREKYENSIKVTNQAYGSSFKSVEVPDTVSSNGEQGNQQLKPLTDVNKAREYLQKAGGDKVKARALAKQDNWTF